MNRFQFDDKIEAVIEDAWKRLGRWRRFVIVIDGRMNVGKSVLARYFSYRLNMPCFHMDLFLEGDGDFLHKPILWELILNRLKQDSPLIVDGIWAAECLGDNCTSPDLIIRVHNSKTAIPRDEEENVLEGARGKHCSLAAHLHYEQRFQADHIVENTFDD